MSDRHGLFSSLPEGFHMSCKVFKQREDRGQRVQVLALTLRASPLNEVP